MRHRRIGQTIQAIQGKRQLPLHVFQAVANQPQLLLDCFQAEAAAVVHGEPFAENPAIHTRLSLRGQVGRYRNTGGRAQAYVGRAGRGVDTKRARAGEDLL